MARAALRWSIPVLALNAGVSPATVRRIEANLRCSPASILAVRQTLARQGFRFIRDRNGDGILFSYAADCLNDLAELAKSAPNEANVDAVIRYRIDHFLDASVALQREWRGPAQNLYSRELKRGLRAAAADAAVNSVPAQVFGKALDYLAKKRRSPAGK